MKRGGFLEVEFSNPNRKGGGVGVFLFYVLYCKKKVKGGGLKLLMR